MKEKSLFVMKSLAVSGLLILIINLMFKDYIVGKVDYKTLFSAILIFFIGEYVYIKYVQTEKIVLLVISVLLFLYAGSLVFF